MEIVKKIAGICFALAFAMALVLFAGIGRTYISLFTARWIFMIAGALGLMLNLISFQVGKHQPLFSFIYWSGSIVLFAGLIFMQFRLPYSQYILITGVLVLGLSFVLPSDFDQKKNEDDLLDMD